MDTNTVVWAAPLPPPRRKEEKAIEHKRQPKKKNLDVDVHIRMSAKEKAAWESKAKKCKMSKSAYLRSLIETSSPKQPPPIEYHQMINQLNQISTALNEIAMVAKRTGHIESAKYAEIVKLVQNILLKIMSEVTLPERR